MLVAPDTEPTGHTGHTGACALEDAGLQIRDAILWVTEGSKLHYVAKASRSEREAGCSSLKGKAGYEAVGRKEGSAGVNNPRAGAGRTAGKQILTDWVLKPGLDPQTVKAIKQRLLERGIDSVLVESL